MSGAKNTFMQMREEEMRDVSSFTKPVLKEKADQVIQLVLDGEVDPIDTKIACKTAIEYFTQIDAGIKEMALTEAQKYGKEKVQRLNAHFETRGGATKVDYSADPVWKELNTRMKAREELLKVSAKTKGVMFDDETGEMPGEEIPKCPIIGGSDMIVISLKTK